VFNGANEVAVQAFLDRRLSFTGIPRLCRDVMDRRHPSGKERGLPAILSADAWARREAASLLA
jgi:1-deoxy-D-xylulose-5-phosphate reductoisomerase